MLSHTNLVKLDKKVTSICDKLAFGTGMKLEEK
jgi:hypothetical protein